MATQKTRPAIISGEEINIEETAEKMARFGGNEDGLFYTCSKDLFQAVLEYMAYSKSVPDDERTYLRGYELMTEGPMEDFASRFQPGVPGTGYYNRFCYRARAMVGNIFTYGVIIWQNYLRKTMKEDQRDRDDREMKLVEASEKALKTVNIAVQHDKAQTENNAGNIKTDDTAKGGKEEPVGQEAKQKLNLTELSQQFMEADKVDIHKEGNALHVEIQKASGNATDAENNDASAAEQPKKEKTAKTKKSNPILDNIKKPIGDIDIEADFVNLMNLMTKVDYVDIWDMDELGTLAYVLDRIGKRDPNSYRTVVRDWTKFCKENNAKELTRSIVLSTRTEMENDSRYNNTVPPHAVRLANKMQNEDFEPQPGINYYGAAFFIGIVDDINMTPHWFQQRGDEYLRNIDFMRMRTVSKCIIEEAEYDREYGLDKATEIFNWLKQYRDLLRDMYYYARHGELADKYACTEMGLTVQQFMSAMKCEPMIAYIAMGKVRAEKGEKRES